MKITQVETFLVAPRWLFVKISTDDGPDGWGEATLESRSEPVAAAVDVLAEYLLGADPLRIEAHWQVLTRSGFYRGGPVLSSAVAGIDQALWDIAGKYRGAPVHELLGGPVRERVRVYSWIGGDDPAEIADQAAAQREAGFTAVKMNGSGALEPIDTPLAVDRTVALAAAAREALGSDADFGIDFHGRFSTAMARRVLRELEPLRPMFVEEPVLPEYAPHRLRDVVESTSIPIATGERIYDRPGFLPVLQAGIGVAQPDLAHCGGISEGRRIASLAETFDVHIAPHCPLGPLALAASLQLAFATPNFLIQEQSAGIHYNTTAELLDYLVDPSVFAFTGGYCPRPTAPGLGVQIDEAAVRKAAADGHRWRGPVWRRRDGSFAEW
ncbi:galactonate dehydratase [Allonocardiopsis opalescens]|uniref:Galactonate dehydratase n=1 Tax=Allonocardiopsis opalescens TaxID=1144618 RepID=A0A2T0QAC1_9ACTN|nr:galactonate dehydratase [Allonocardiopsis opalescens]PRY00804.1 galactonate dehydratase [Allonocardiopsis opalescens]